MSESKVLEKIAELGILPVIKIECPDDAVQLAAALRDGGINAIEVTVRNESALDSICRIKEAFPDMLVGAGTVTSISLIKQAKAAGAVFAVSPGLDRGCVEYALSISMPIVPGCVTPSEIQSAQELGLTTVKFFPAGRYGGVAAIKELAGPFYNMRFLPTGGIGFDEIGEYLKCSAVAAVGGSFMAKSDVIARHDWEKITENCKKCIELSLGFELAHVGINNSNRSEAINNATAMSGLFPLGVKVGGKSTFLGSSVEFMHSMYYGAHGHIGYKVNSCERALAYFVRNGYEINTDSISRDEKGNISFFYLKDEIAGFALHVVKK